MERTENAPVRRARQAFEGEELGFDGLLHRLRDALPPSAQGNIPPAWSDVLAYVARNATAAERSRWLSRIEGLRSKAREAVQ